MQNPLDTAAVDTYRNTGTAAVPMDVVAEIVSRNPNIDFVLYMGFNVVPQTEPASEERDQTIVRMRLLREMRRNAPVPVVPIGLTCLEPDRSRGRSIATLDCGCCPASSSA